MYFITTKRMLEVCFSAHPNIQYRTKRRIMHTDLNNQAAKRRLYLNNLSCTICPGAFGIKVPLSRQQ